MILSLIWLLLALPWLAGSRFIPYDSQQQFYPAVAFTVQQLRELQGPWWNPYLFGGYPQFSDPQAMSFQPSIVLPMLLSPLPSLRWFDTVVLLHVLLAGLGAIRLARSYDLRPAAQLLFALVLMYAGVAASRMQHTPMIVSYAYLPWLWWSLRRLGQEPGAGRATITGIVGGLCALQMTQLTYLIGLCALIYAVVLCLRPPGFERRRLGYLVFAAAVAGMVCLPQWISTFAFLPYSNRGQMTLAAAWDGSLSWPTLSTLVAGNFLSHTYGRYWGPGDLSQEYLYLGAVPLSLWLAWGGAAAARNRGLVRMLMLVAVLALVYALGLRTPFYPLLYDYLPGVDLFRRPVDALFLFVPAAGLLAALALQARLDAVRWRPHWGSILVAVVLIGYTCWYATVANARPEALTALAVSIAIAAVALWLLRPTRKAGTATLTALLVLVTFDLAAHNVRARFYGSRGEARHLYRTEVQPSHDASPAASVLSELRRRLRPGERAELFGVLELINGASVHGVAMTAGYNPLLYAAYARTFGASTHPLSDPSQRPFTPWAPDFSAPAFDLLGLRTIVSRAPIDGAQSIGGVHYLTRETTLPRILNPVSARAHDAPMPPPADFNRTDFREIVWLPSSEIATAACDRRAAGKAEVGHVSYSANRVDIEYRADRPAWLIVNEITAPGWYAQVDGRELPLLRANALFRGACVPAGVHRLRFAYSPLRLFETRWRDRSKPSTSSMLQR